MNAKRNLTVAALAALLAVPALNGTNISHTLHMPSVTAHADEMNTGFAEAAEIMDNDGGAHGIPASEAGGGTVDPGIESSVGGNDIKVFENEAFINGQPASAAQVLSLLKGGQLGSSNGNNNSSTNSSSNGNAQYTSQSGKLPQTNENNGANKAMALGASALVASAGLMALSFARKHKYMESVDLASNTDTVSASNGKDNNDDTPKYSNKSSYNMIMSDTFADLGKSLKNL